MEEQESHREQRSNECQENQDISMATEDAIEDEVNRVVMLCFSEFKLEGLHDHQQQNCFKSNEIGQEVTVISFSDTHPNPWTMMVYLLYTDIAYPAVGCSWWTIQPTRLTVFHYRKMRFNPKIVIPESSYSYLRIQSIGYSSRGMGHIVGYNTPLGSILGITPGSMKISERWRMLLIPQMMDVAMMSYRELSWAEAMKQMAIEPWQSTRTAKKLRGCERKANLQCLPSLLPTLQLESIVRERVFFLEIIIIILMHHQYSNASSIRNSEKAGDC